MLQNQMRVPPDEDLPVIFHVVGNQQAISTQIRFTRLRTPFPPTSTQRFSILHVGKFKSSDRRDDIIEEPNWAYTKSFTIRDAVDLTASYGIGAVSVTLAGCTHSLTIAGFRGHHLKYIMKWS